MLTWDWGDSSHKIEYISSWKIQAFRTRPVGVSSYCLTGHFPCPDRGKMFISWSRQQSQSRLIEQPQTGLLSLPMQSWPLLSIIFSLGLDVLGKPLSSASQYISMDRLVADLPTLILNHCHPQPGRAGAATLLGLPVGGHLLPRSQIHLQNFHTHCSPHWCCHPWGEISCSWAFP